MSDIVPLINNMIAWTAVIHNNKGDILIEGTQYATDKLEISTSIYSLFTYGQWTHKGDPNLVESMALAIGTKIDFVFYANQNIVEKRTLSILGINIDSLTNAQHLGEGFTLILISSWYFDQISTSRAYKGNITTIVKTMIDEELSSSFSKINLINSYDPTGAIRYRTEMTPSAFITKRLLDHLRGKDDTAVFAYSNDRDEFEIIDYPSIGNYPYYIAIDFSHPHLGAFQQRLNDPILNTYMIYPNKYQLRLNDTEEKDLWMLSNPGLLYMYHVNGDTKIASDDPVLKFLGNNSSKRFTLVKSEVVPTTRLKTFMDDSFHDYADIYSSILREYNTRLIKNQSVHLTTLPNPTVKIGRFCYLYVTNSDNTRSSLIYQKYIITDVSQVYLGIRAVSYITLGIPSFEYTNESDISDLWHPE